MTSQQVTWVTVLDFVRRRGIDPTKVLLAGSPSWAELPDDHPDKLAAVLAAGVHHALRIDTNQAAIADASREISRAATWSKLAQPRGNTYIPRRRSA